MNFTPEQLTKAKAAKSAEELLSMAKAESFPMTEEEAEKYFAELHKEGMLSDDELDMVAGGKGEPEPKYHVGNIVVESIETTHNSSTYEVLAIHTYSESANSWEYTCLNLESNYEAVKKLDSNPNVKLYSWTKDSR